MESGSTSFVFFEDVFGGQSTHFGSADNSGEEEQLELDKLKNPSRGINCNKLPYHLLCILGSYGDG